MSIRRASIPSWFPRRLVQVSALNVDRAPDLQSELEMPSPVSSRSLLHAQMPLNWDFGKSTSGTASSYVKTRWLQLGTRIDVESRWEGRTKRLFKKFSENNDCNGATVQYSIPAHPILHSIVDFLAPSVRRVCPGPDQNRYMIMSLSFLDVELHLDFRPEALDPTVLIPGPNVKLDAPRRRFALPKSVQRLIQALMRRRLGRGPFLNPSVLIRDRVK